MCRAFLSLVPLATIGTGAGLLSVSNAAAAPARASGIAVHAAGTPSSTRASSPWRTTANRNRKESLRPGVPAAKAPAAKARCSLGVIEAVAGESSAADARLSASWTLLRANGWTVFVPNQDWHLSASDAGADVASPDGLSDASLATWYSLGTPWTFASLRAKYLAPVTGIHVVCSSPVVQNSAAQTQAVELTGRYLGERIHAAIIFSLLTPSPGSELSVGETRSLFTPLRQWSAANERTLMLIIKRAIQVPRQA